MQNNTKVNAYNIDQSWESTSPANIPYVMKTYHNTRQRLHP